MNRNRLGFCDHSVPVTQLMMRFLLFCLVVTKDFHIFVA